MSGFGIAEPIVSLSEAQAYVRIETGEEEAVLAGMTGSATIEVVQIGDFAPSRPARLSIEF